jgi:uncharacterized protein (DUF58 family)
MLTVEESRQLDRFSLGSLTGVPTSHAAGVRVARARGLGHEFHDFRPYQPQDDPRTIDWTIYARLRQLVVQVRRADARLRVHLFLDTSASMSAGMPDKLACARRLAALLCYVAIRQRDAVGVTFFDTVVTRQVPPASGRPQMHRVFELLTACRAAGRSAIDRALIDYANAVQGPGLIVIISDFFQDADVLGALRYLCYRGLTPAIVQVVAREEIAPAVAGETELRDLEDPDRAPVVVDERAVAAYEARMSALYADLAEFCATHGLASTRIDASAPFGQWLEACVHAGILAGRSDRA